ncbi:hypothetical protein HDE_12827 [Halotydeus destructor]|nr:hypothetical protein HDE_12827 [Halotydeus destructor]
MSRRSLADLNDDIIGHVIYFAPHIWDVLNFTATSRRLNSVTERHLKTVKHLDLRIPYFAKTKSAEVIEQGIKQLCLERCGNQLSEIKITKPERWKQDTQFIRSLHLLPLTLMKLIDCGEKLEGLRYQLFSNEDTIAKQRKIVLSTHEMSTLSAVMDKSDSSVSTGLRRDFSAVRRLDIIFSDKFDVHGVSKCCTLFQNLEAVGIHLESHYYLDLNSFLVKFISLLSQIDEKIQIKVRHWTVLCLPALILGLKDYLPRLQVYTSHITDEPYMMPGAFISAYEELESSLNDQFYAKYREGILQSVSRSKNTTDLRYSEEEVIRFHGRYTETLTLVLYHIKPLDRRRLFKLIEDNCPNFRFVNLDFAHNSEDRILDFFEHFGHLLETVTIYYYEEGRLSFDMFVMILDQCPKLQRFESNGIVKEELEQYLELYGRFRRTRHLEYVKLHTGPYTEELQAFPSSLLYLNGRMASTDQEDLLYSG